MAKAAESAEFTRASVMRNFTFGERGEYPDGNILLVRQQ